MNQKGEMNLGKMEGLRAGVAEMRSVAARLLAWTEDLEDSFQDQATLAGEVVAGVLGEVVPEEEKAVVTGLDGVAAHTAVASASIPVEPLILEIVRETLAEKCAAGYGAQVKALIESFGVSALSEVPPLMFRELVAKISSFVLDYIYVKNKEAKFNDEEHTVSGILPDFTSLCFIWKCIFSQQ